MTTPSAGAEHHRLEAITRCMAEAEEAVEAAWVFGSAARGGVRADSDLDIAVRWGPNRRPGGVPRRLIGLLMEASGREIQLVDLDEAPQALRFQIFRDGICLFDKNPEATQRLHERTLLERFDWAPLMRIIEENLASRFSSRRRNSPDHG